MICCGVKIEACIAKEININEIFINYEKPKNGSYIIKDGHFTLLIFMRIIKKENAVHNSTASRWPQLLPQDPYR